jgi:hypothetical protein
VQFADGRRVTNMDSSYTWIVSKVSGSFPPGVSAEEVECDIGRAGPVQAWASAMEP